jgi:hypothetical protein
LPRLRAACSDVMKTRYSDPLLDWLVRHGVGREQLAVEWIFDRVSRRSENDHRRGTARSRATGNRDEVAFVLSKLLDKTPDPREELAVECIENTSPDGRDPLRNLQLSELRDEVELIFMKTGVCSEAQARSRRRSVNRDSSKERNRAPV